jgi:putative colanic acid biosynthesis glycosyltransferase
MNNQIYKLSIVTVTKDDCAGLLQTGESIKRQKNRDFEWIVIDGDSCDGTKSLLKKYEAEGCVFVSERDGGIYDAMNKGTLMATGSHIMYLNAGDELFDSNSTLRIRENVERNCINNINCFGARIFFRKSMYMDRYPKKVQSISQGSPCIHQAAVIPLSVAMKFPFNSSYKICGDANFFGSVLRENILLSCFSELIVNFKMGGVSTTKPFLFFMETRRAIKENCALGVLACNGLMFRRFLSLVFVQLCWRISACSPAFLMKVIKIVNQRRAMS